MLTLGTTYYNNPSELINFVNLHLDYVDELIVVDDGSALSITNYLVPSDKLRIFRVKKDYGFNSHGCRNLIMKQSTNDWVILLDVDRNFIRPHESIGTIRKRLPKLNTRKLHRFLTHVRHEGNCHESVNDFLIHRDHFFSAGGYDEEIIGIRTGDREYFEQLLHFGGERLMQDVSIIFTRGPSTLIRGDTMSPFDRVLGNRQSKTFLDHIKVIDRMINPEPNKSILTFEWEEIKP